MLRSLLGHTREDYKCQRVSKCLHTGQTILERRQYPNVTKTDDDYDPFSVGNFHLTPEDKRKYDTWFDQHEPEAGRLSEEKVRNSLMEGTELPDSTLDKIWELSDQDRDGFLDRYEWTVAIHLTFRADVYGDEIPDQVFISPHSSHSIIRLNIAASPSIVQREHSQPSTRCSSNVSVDDVGI